MNATKEKPLFLEELERLMAEKGIEDLEELHRRLVESGHGYIPFPGLHSGKPISFELFERHVARRDSFVYGEFLVGLTEVFGLTEEEAEDLGFIYLMGEPRRA